MAVPSRTDWHEFVELTAATGSLKDSVFATLGQFFMLMLASCLKDSEEVLRPSESTCDCWFLANRFWLIRIWLTRAWIKAFWAGAGGVTCCGWGFAVVFCKAWISCAKFEFAGFGVWTCDWANEAGKFWGAVFVPVWGRIPAKPVGNWGICWGTLFGKNPVPAPNCYISKILLNMTLFKKIKFRRVTKFFLKILEFKLIRNKKSKKLSISTFRKKQILFTVQTTKNISFIQSKYKNRIF